jgi:hypothetical protein
MPTQIHQINLAFHPVHDRLLLRVSTTDQAEFRVWLTRRFTKGLWKALMQLLEADEVVSRQADVESRKTVLAFQHEQAVSNAQFSNKYADQVQSRPLGDAPLLVSRIAIRPVNPETSILALHTEKGRGIELAMNRQLAHSFTKLLAENVARAEWDLDLEMMTAEATQSEAPRQLM